MDINKLELAGTLLATVKPKDCQKVWIRFGFVHILPKKCSNVMFFVLTDLFNDQYQRKTSKYSNIHTKTVRTDFDLQKL